jgi:hypothetical protein
MSLKTNKIIMLSLLIWFLDLHLCLVKQVACFPIWFQWPLILCSLDLSKVSGFKPCMFVRPNFFRCEKTHLGLNYIWKDILFEFFPSKMSLVVAHSSSLNWWRGGNKNLRFYGCKYSCCDFWCGFELGEGATSSTITNP